MLPSTRKTRTRSPPCRGRYDLRPSIENVAFNNKRRKYTRFIILTIFIALAELFILLSLF